MVSWMLFDTQTHKRMAALEHVLRAPVRVEFIHSRHDKQFFRLGAEGQWDAQLVGVRTRNSCTQHRGEGDHRAVLTCKESITAFPLLCVSGREQKQQSCSLFTQPSPAEGKPSLHTCCTLLLPFSVVPFALPQQTWSITLQTLQHLFPVRELPMLG